MLHNPNWNKPNPVRDVLLDAADLLEKHGHTKFIRQASDGSMCLLGAIETAQQGKELMVYEFHDTELTRQAADAIVKTLGLSLLDFYPTELQGPAAAACWNNKPERTAEEVIAVMRETAYSLVTV